MDVNAMWSVKISCIMIVCCAASLTAKQPGRSVKTRLVSKYYRLKPCMIEDNAILVRNITYTMDRDGSELINADFEIKYPATKLTGMKFVIYKCALGSATDCVYYTTLTWSMPACQLLVAKNMLWTPIVDNIHPRVACPLQPGAYTGTNLTADVDSLGQISKLNGYKLEGQAWASRFTVDSGERQPYACIDGAVEYRRVRTRD